MYNDSYCNYHDKRKSIRIRLRIEVPKNKSPSYIQETAGFPDGPHSLSRTYGSFLSFFVVMMLRFCFSTSSLCSATGRLQPSGRECHLVAKLNAPDLFTREGGVISGKNKREALFSILLSDLFDRI